MRWHTSTQNSTHTYQRVIRATKHKGDVAGFYRIWTTQKHIDKDNNNDSNNGGGGEEGAERVYRIARLADYLNSTSRSGVDDDDLDMRHDGGDVIDPEMIDNVTLHALHELAENETR